MAKEIAYKDFDTAEIYNCDIVKPGKKTKKKKFYKNVVCAFDIETTRIPSTEQTVMYIWQWCFYYGENNYTAIYGRTWEDFKDFMSRINKVLKDNEKLLVFIHNASYEYQFLRGIFKFNADDVFCMKSRKILSFNIGKVEFRCSYLQTNMSLKVFLQKMGAKHQKQELDYTGERYSDTELTTEEMRYNLNDVIGLCEAMHIQMVRDGDNFYTIPKTSTGYVRRDAKAAMYTLGRSYIEGLLPDFDTFVELNEAFRGGDTHANRFYSDQIIEGVIHSADRSSSYPAVQCNDQFPMSKFYNNTARTLEEVDKLINVRGRAVIARVTFYNITLANKYFGCPYLSKSKCRNIVDGRYDNGRVLSAGALTTTITDIDLKIIQTEYKWSSCGFFDVKTARYGMLPDVLRRVVLDYYYKKTTLKNVEGSEYLYMKSKNKLNSVYGMTAENPLKDDTKFEEEDYVLHILEDPGGELEVKNKRAFLSYAWATWTTALARLRLHEGIWKVCETKNAAFIYCDTDSIKYIGDVDFTDYNNKRIAESTKNRAFAADPQGEMHYMGVFEQESDMIAFKTMGAKKYCYIDTNGKLHLTCAGVSKVKGAAELEEHGGIDAFTEGFIFKEAGGLEAVYNDMKAGEFIMVKDPAGREHKVTSNVTLKESTYTLSLTDEYKRLLIDEHLII